MYLFFFISYLQLYYNVLPGNSQAFLSKKFEKVELFFQLFLGLKNKVAVTLFLFDVKFNELAFDVAVVSKANFLNYLVHVSS